MEGYAGTGLLEPGGGVTLIKGVVEGSLGTIGVMSCGGGIRVPGESLGIVGGSGTTQFGVLTSGVGKSGIDSLSVFGIGLPLVGIFRTPSSSEFGSCSGGFS